MFLARVPLLDEVERMKYFLWLLPCIAIALGATISPSPLNGSWELQYQGCSGTSYEQQIAEMRELQRQDFFRHWMVINGNLLVEEIQYSPFCVLHIESVFKQRDGGRFELDASYAKSTKFCEKKFKQIQKRVKQGRHQYFFKERLRPLKHRLEGVVLVAGSEENSGECPGGQRYEKSFTFKTSSFFIYDWMYFQIERLVKAGEIKPLNQHLFRILSRNKLSADDYGLLPLSMFNLEYRDREGRTFLALAAAHGRNEMAKELVKAGASLLSHDRFGRPWSFWLGSSGQGLVKPAE